MADAIEMARDAIGLKGIDYEDDQKRIPTPSTSELAVSKVVRRNVTLPNWLNAEAEKAQINVSRVLQEALINVLGLSRKY